jgi:hypothetical protein
MRYSLLNILLSAILVVLTHLTVSANEPIVSLNQMPGSELRGFRSIKSAQDGGILLVSEDAGTRLYSLKKLSANGLLEKSVAIPEEALDTNQLLRDIQVEVVQLLSGDVVVISHNGSDNQRGTTRLARFSSDLEYISSTTYYAGDLFRKVDNILPSNAGGFVVMYFSNFSRTVRLVHFAANGTIIWQRNNTMPLTVTAVQRIRLLALTNDNGASYYNFVPSFIVLKITQPFNYTFLSYRYASNGNLQQTVDKPLLSLGFDVNDFPTLIGVAQEPGGHRFVFSAASEESPFVRIYQELISPSNQLLATADYELDILYVQGSVRSFVSNNDEVLSVGSKHLFHRRLNGTQNTEIVPLLNSSINSINYRFVTPRVGGGWWVNGIVDFGNGIEQDVFVGLPAMDFDIEGTVFKDFSNDCVLSGSDVPYRANWVGFKNVIGYYTTPDTNGFYTLRLPEATYEAEVVQPGRLWELCASQAVLVADADKEHDLPMQPKADCPDMTVDVTAPFLVRCEENEYRISYQNVGPSPAEGAYIELRLDTLLSITDSEVPFSVLANGFYRFDLGNVAADFSASFKVWVFLNCDESIPGQTHCAEANIFPDSLCTPEPTCWDGAQLVIEGNCEGDTAFFRIFNIGRDPMNNPRPVLVLEDDIMRQPTTPLQLPAGGFQEFIVQAAGKTIRVQVPQGDCFPFPSFPAKVLEGCGGILNTGFVTTLFQDDMVGSKSIWCLESVESTPEAFLHADPKGYDDLRFISDSTELEYSFFFDVRSSGTGDLYLIDSLSQHLDISSLKVGGSSLPYNLTLFNNGVLKVAFDLSATNDETGFFKFKVLPIKGTAPGSVVNNCGKFYRRNASSVISNTTFHTIDQEFIRLILSTVSDDWKNKLEVAVFPNPFARQFRIRMDMPLADKVWLQVFDMQGRIITVQQLTGDDVISAEQWPTGMYLFSILSGDKSVASGKLIRH